MPVKAAIGRMNPIKLGTIKIMSFTISQILTPLLTKRSAKSNKFPTMKIKVTKNSEVRKGIKSSLMQ